MKTWVIVLILIVVVFVIVPLIYFTVIVRNADKLIAPDNKKPDFYYRPLGGGTCEQLFGPNYTSNGGDKCIKK